MYLQSTLLCSVREVRIGMHHDDTILGIERPVAKLFMPITETMTIQQDSLVLLPQAAPLDVYSEVNCYRISLPSVCGVFFLY